METGIRGRHRPITTVRYESLVAPHLSSNPRVRHASEIGYFERMKSNLSPENFIWEASYFLLWRKDPFSHLTSYEVAAPLSNER